MKIVWLLVAIVSSVPSCVLAQIPSVYEGAAFDASTKGSDELSISKRVFWRKVIQNQSQSDLVAFKATYTCGASKSEFLHDPLIRYGRDAHVPPQGSIEINGADPAQCHGGLNAAIFADGHTEGTPEGIAALYARRRGTYEAIGVVISLLTAIPSGEMTVKQVENSLEDRARALSNNQQIDEYERTGMIATYSQIRQALLQSATIHTPSDDTAARMPDARQVASSQNISFQEAQAVVFVKKLREWQADLQGNLKQSPAN